MERAEEEEDGTGDGVGPALAVGSGGGGIKLVVAVLRVIILGLRNLGTRVSFCSSSFTRARISETICTPLLLICTVAVELPSADVLRLGVGRARTGLGVAKCDGLLIVVDLGRRILVAGDNTPVRGGWKPARAKFLDEEVNGGLRSGEARSRHKDGRSGDDSFFLVMSGAGTSKAGVRSAKLRSAGVGILRRSSSEIEV